MRLNRKVGRFADSHRGGTRQETREQKLNAQYETTSEIAGRCSSVPTMQGSASDTEVSRAYLEERAAEFLRIERRQAGKHHALVVSVWLASSLFFWLRGVEFPLAAVPGVFVTSLFVYGRMWRQRQTLQPDAILQELEAADSPHKAGILIRTALQAQDHRSHWQIIPALTRSLSALRTEDAPLLCEEDRIGLAELLERTPGISMRFFAKFAFAEAQYQKDYTDFAITAVQTLARIGDTHRLRVIQRLVKSCGKLTGLTTIRTAAETTINTLAASERLLRPASAEKESVLLRPVQGITEAESEQLLRPALLEAEGTRSSSPQALPQTERK